MPCDGSRLEGMEREARKKLVKSTLERLEAALKEGLVTVKVGPQGALTFAGWKDRNGVSDVCAYRMLTTKGSGELRKALARAEAMAGRKISTQAIGHGVHSHDGGSTWHAGH